MLVLVALAFAKPHPKPEKPEKSEEVEKTEKSEKAEKAEKAEKVDVAALFEGLPAEGSRRCRSKDPDVAMITSSYVGGAPPPPDLITGGVVLYVDGREVGSATYTYATGWPDSAPMARPVESMILHQARQYDEITRVQESVVITRADGRPLYGDVRELAVTWLCESVLTPPYP
ncbi:MAG: hypothetical protein H6737_08225 [Alphaproteobacteria bacterium]|nr:hypothetical protein [Alphaproteobacteria bacterium]